jgi:hypothetical protein
MEHDRIPIADRMQMRLPWPAYPTRGGLPALALHLQQPQQHTAVAGQGGTPADQIAPLQLVQRDGTWIGMSGGSLPRPLRLTSVLLDLANTLIH